MKIRGILPLAFNDFKLEKARKIHQYPDKTFIPQFEAHSDYLRSIAVHPTQPFLLTSSDDMLVKLWDWEKNWQLKQTFEGWIITYNRHGLNVHFLIDFLPCLNCLQETDLKIV
jgi:WD40 repeat protein